MIFVEDELPSWMRYDFEDFSKVQRFLSIEEKRLLDLLQSGKTQSDVAEILEMPSRQLVDKEIKRLCVVIRFYLEYADILNQLAGYRLAKERECLIELFVIKRKSYLEVAKILNLDVQVLNNRFRFLLDHLSSMGYGDLARMLKVAWSTRQLRASAKGMRKDRRIESGMRKMEMVGQAWRYELRDLLFEMIGRVWYVWGGQKIKWDDRSGLTDCSGLVIEGLKKVKRLPQNFRDTTAQGLYNYFANRTNLPELCDLAFYGKSKTQVTHVMFYVGTKWPKFCENANFDKIKAELVIGMCDGQKNMTDVQAQLMGAGLFVRCSPKYRSDFLSYGVVQ